jgi:hypothetical protein
LTDGRLLPLGEEAGTGTSESEAGALANVGRLAKSSTGTDLAIRGKDDDVCDRRSGRSALISVVKATDFGTVPPPDRGS